MSGGKWGEDLPKCNGENGQPGIDCKAAMKKKPSKGWTFNCIHFLKQLLMIDDLF